MTTPIPIQQLFAGLDSSANTQLKSQRSALVLSQPSDFQVLLDYFYKAAVIKTFDQRVITPLAKQLKGLIKSDKDDDGKPLKVLASPEHFAESWRQFVELSDACLSADKVSSGKNGEIYSPIGLCDITKFLVNGASMLCSHLDKSSELPQAHAYPVPS